MGRRFRSCFRGHRIDDGVDARDAVGREAARLGVRAHGVLGWKVNGSGGEGGSHTLLCGASSAEKRALLRAVEAADPAFRHVPTRLSRHGLRVWTLP